MQDGEDRGAGPEVLRIGRDGELRLGGGTEQRVIHRALMGAGHRAEFLGQGEGDQEVGTRQETGPVAIEPASRLLPVALGAVPVATRVIAILEGVAGIAPAEMSAPCGGATGGEVLEGAAMRRKQTRAARLAIGGTHRPDDVSQFEHRRRRRLREAVHQVRDGIEGQRRS